MTTDPAFMTFLGTIIGAAITAVGAIFITKLANRSTRESSKETNAIDWARELNDRLAKVERDLKEIKVELAVAQRVIVAAIGYINQLLWWVRTGRPGRVPSPPSLLHEHIDPNLLANGEDN